MVTSVATPSVLMSLASIGRLDTNSFGIPRHRRGLDFETRHPRAADSGLEGNESTADWLLRISRNDLGHEAPGMVRVSVLNYERGPIVIHFEEGAVQWRGYHPPRGQPFLDLWTTRKEAEWILFHGLCGWLCSFCGRARIKPLKPETPEVIKTIAWYNDWKERSLDAPPAQCPWCRRFEDVEA